MSNSKVNLILRPNHKKVTKFENIYLSLDNFVNIPIEQCFVKILNFNHENRACGTKGSVMLAIHKVNETKTENNGNRQTTKVYNWVRFTNVSGSYCKIITDEQLKNMIKSVVGLWLKEVYFPAIAKLSRIEVHNPPIEQKQYVQNGKNILSILKKNEEYLDVVIEVMKEEWITQNRIISPNCTVVEQLPPLSVKSDNHIETTIRKKKRQISSDEMKKFIQNVNEFLFEKNIINKPLKSKGYQEMLLKEFIEELRLWFKRKNGYSIPNYITLYNNVEAALYALDYLVVRPGNVRKLRWFDGG